MNPQARKYHECPRCGMRATLRMDIREKKPLRDEKKNLLYYCIWCGLTFVVDTDGNVV